MFCFQQASVMHRASNSVDKLKPRKRLSFIVIIPKGSTDLCRFSTSTILVH